ncbi:pantetheinase-like [Gigantopelta aegis]|uniref:pantetheinase-like n=1 Tax=Gigantopelta aegis TaxID=1735272 RepID=UPI001B888484|nr:pantetheinase-like [Gigantopelta aegis]
MFHSSTRMLNDVFNIDINKADGTSSADIADAVKCYVCIYMMVERSILVHRYLMPSTPSRMATRLFVCLFLLSCGLCDKFKVAVYEHVVILPNTLTHVVTRPQAVELMEKNLKIYETQARRAHDQNVSILIFPENGLYGPGFAREALWPYLEFVPDPLSIQSWNPCEEPDRYSRSDVQHRLSCLANSTSLFLVANIGYGQPCSGSDCPLDGHFQYSTNVVYNSTGAFIARYLKQNPMKEHQFDAPQDVDVVSFETPFGKFGLITNWDLLFHDPTVKLVEDLDIGNLILPSSWVDVAPFLMAVEYHSAFAMGLGVNVLAANLHLLNDSIQGSGIYTPEGPAVYYYNTSDTSGRLLVSEVKNISKPFRYSSEKINIPFFNVSRELTPEGHKGSNSTHFQSLVNHDLFNIVKLTDKNATLKVCQKKLCCKMEYSMSPVENETFVFGAFDGFHTYEGHYYTQICALLKCKNISSASCNSSVTIIDTNFTSLHIRGTFKTQYVYPELMVANQGVASLAPGKFQFRDHSLVFSNASLHLLSASLYSRVYPKITNSASAPVITRLCLPPFAIFIISLFRIVY